MKPGYRVAAWAAVNDYTEGKIAIPYEYGAQHPKIYMAMEAYDGEVGQFYIALFINFFFFKLRSTVRNFATR